MPKQFFCIIDTETTQDGLVADFAAVICDRKGTVHHQCAALVRGVYDAPDQHPLFYSDRAGDLWARAGLPKRYARYNAMLENGARVLASPEAINRWLMKAIAKYVPTLTAYNLPFDVDKMNNTGLLVELFDNYFCLWRAACEKWARKKAYREFVLNSHAFNAPTEKGNMTYKTNAEVMARFVLGNPMLEDEPHTALEDILFYELPILRELFRSKRTTLARVQEWNRQNYNWRSYQVRDHYTVT